MPSFAAGARLCGRREAHEQRMVVFEAVALLEPFEVLDMHRHADLQMLKAATGTSLDQLVWR